MAGSGSFFPASGTVVIPWYATGFRGDGLQEAVEEIAAVSLRYGATSYAVYRARDDRYKIHQFVTFEDALSWERYWEGQEMIDFRARHSSWYQVPVLYGWWDKVAGGGLDQQRSNGAIVSPAPLS